MLTAEYLRCVYDYSYWARDRILTQVSQLDHDAYVADAKLDYGSIRGTLVHILEREATWLARWEGRPDQLLGEQALPTFETLCEAWSREETKMRAFLQRLSDPILIEVVEYESTLSGRRYAIPLWKMMAHLAHHGTQHRSEVALALTQLGHSPGDLDLIVYFDPRPL
jgi:uncharacterized damage-inducible protein DinB